MSETNIRAEVNLPSKESSWPSIHQLSIDFDFILSHYKNGGFVILLGGNGSTLLSSRSVELLFEGYSCIEKVAFVLDGPSVIDPAIPTALVIHIGSIAPTFIQLSRISSIGPSERINWGGIVAAEFMLKILGLKYPGILNSSNPNKLTSSQVQAIWHKCALIAPSVADFESEMDALSRASDTKTLATSIVASSWLEMQPARLKTWSHGWSQTGYRTGTKSPCRRNTNFSWKITPKNEEQREAKIQVRKTFNYKAVGKSSSGFKEEKVGCEESWRWWRHFHGIFWWKRSERKFRGII